MSNNHVCFDVYMDSYESPQVKKKREMTNTESEATFEKE